MFAWLCARHWDEDEGARERGRVGIVIKSYLIECGRVGRRVGSKGLSVLLQGFNSQSRRGQDAVASDFFAASGTTLNSESVGVRESEMVEGTSDGEINPREKQIEKKEKTEERRSGDNEENAYIPFSERQALPGTIARRDANAPNASFRAQIPSQLIRSYSHRSLDDDDDHGDDGDDDGTM